MATAPPPGATTGHRSPAEVIESLKQLYLSKILPVERHYLFGEFHSPLLTPSDFDAKPQVLLLGQYSVGKTSFIRYLLGRDFPGIRIGPEPTTDRFVAVMNGPEERVIPGNALAVHEDLPFTSLTRFGTNFLNKLEASQLPNPLLERITLIDTPGVLSGEKQRIGRSYDFVKVVEWFAQRADMILLLFDAHKLDISDEFKNAIEALSGQDDKIRVVLNKADKVSAQQLMRVYGAMMWALGKVVKTPEVMRVYIGSFWDGPVQNVEFRSLFAAEQSDLLKDLANLPRYAAVRKINELVKRARLAKVHALIIGHLRKQMPMFGKDKKYKELMDNLAEHFFSVQKAHRLPLGDFPNLSRFREIATTFNFKDLNKLDERMLGDMEVVLSRGIPNLLHSLGSLPQEAAADWLSRPEFSGAGGTYAVESEGSAAGAGAGAGAGHTAPYSGPPTAPPALPEAAPAPAPAPAPAAGAGNPFGPSAPPAEPSPQELWERRVNKAKADARFKTLDGAESGKVTGAAVKAVMEESELSSDDLFAIWNLSDVDNDGFLDAEEFALALHLIKNAKVSGTVPSSLAPELVPPSKA